MHSNMATPDSQRYPKMLFLLKYKLDINFCLKGSDRLDMLIGLRVQYCREFFYLDTYEIYIIYINWILEILEYKLLQFIMNSRC